MQRLFKYFICLAWLVWGVPSLINAQQSSDFNADKLNAYLDTLVQNDKLMGAVAISKDGEVIYKRAVGFENLNDPQEKADDQTLYRIGSITKMYTATLVMQLVEQGKLSLSETLDQYYPELPNADQITIKHLLEHKSGLFNFTNDPTYTEWMTDAKTKQQMLDIISDLKVEFEPGEQQKYSNTNYVLLHYILEEAGGASYAQQLNNRIIEPLGMRQTYFQETDQPDREAASFRYVDDQWQSMSVTDMSIPGGAGAIISTPEELTRFIRALFNGELVKSGTLDMMKPSENTLGLGMMQFPFAGKTAYGHNGGIDGFQSNLSYFPEADMAFAFTGNAMNYNMNDLLIGLLSIYFDRPFEIPSFNQETVELAPSELQKYEGTFVSEQLPIDLKVFVEEEQLKAQATGQSSFPLTANSETRFRFDPAGIVIEFEQLKEGKYQKLILNQAGGSFPFTRK